MIFTDYEYLVSLSRLTFASRSALTVTGLHLFFSFLDSHIFIRRLEVSHTIGHSISFSTSKLSVSISDWVRLSWWWDRVSKRFLGISLLKEQQTKACRRYSWAWSGDSLHMMEVFGLKWLSLSRVGSSNRRHKKVVWSEFRPFIIASLQVLFWSFAGFLVWV